MSVIVALRTADGRSTWIGSDTMVCSSDLKLDYGPKWVIHEPWAVGIAGHLRTVNLVAHNAASLLGNLESAYQFSGRARDLMKADGYRDNAEDRGPTEFGGAFILSCPTGAWTIASDFSVSAIPAGAAWAEGSGREISLGAMHALQSLRGAFAPDVILRHAIEAAISFDIACGGRVWLMELA